MEGRRGRRPRTAGTLSLHHLTMKSIVRQIGVVLMISGILAAVANSVHPRRIPWVQDWSNHLEARARKAAIKVIPLSVAFDRHQSGESVFVDARSAEEYEGGHIPGALSIPFQSFDDHFETLGRLIDAGREVVLYCRSRECDDALLLAIELQSMGGTNLALYVDGFERWKAYGGATSSTGDRGDADSPAGDRQ